ncbi:MAG: hypothetical protein [Microviridae sp.]|nr:MAG: hypothetical protein [Microviridae sp.]
MSHIVKKFLRGLAYGRSRREHPDPTPVEVPLRNYRPISSLEDLRRLMKELSAEAAREGKESFDEANDFGEEGEFDDYDAPAQLKHQAVEMAKDHQFERRRPQPRAERSRKGDKKEEAAK